MPESYAKKKQTINGFSYVYYTFDEKYDYEHQYLRNMLHQHNGFLNGKMIPFSEVGQIMGIYQTEWSWSPLFADYDNDGDKDLFVTNGFPKDLTDKDWTKYKAEVFGHVADEKHVIDRAPAAKTYNYAFENKGGSKFEKVTSSWFEPRESYSYGAAFADMDNDGDLDYIVNNTNDEAFVYKNTSVESSKSSSNFCRLKLVGPPGNSFAFGAKVELWSNGQYQFQENFLARGYVSSVDPTIHFGLGQNMVIDSIRVIWPGERKESLLYELTPNQTIEIGIESAQLIRLEKGFGGDDLLFQQVEGKLDYTHSQIDFIDFYYKQNLLPHKLSQIGPRMTIGDIDRDGRDDIIIGCTNDTPTKFYQNTGDAFKEKSIEGLHMERKFPEADLAVVDIDLDGDNDIIAVSGGYETTDEKDFKHYIYENIDGTFRPVLLPISTFSASVVKPFDYDHDGDLDLFIGARIKKDMYPLGADSWLLINDQGKFSKENCLSFNVGMVTDAIWVDYDQDGWEDLLLAREWNSVAVLKNHEGQNLKTELIPEFEKLHGYWYSITAGDFDQDGDEDLILGNLGNNHRFHVSAKYPMQIYALDADMNGILDPIITAYWENGEGVMTEYPISYFDELMTQIPTLFKTFSNYSSFSYAAFSEFFDQSVMDRVVVKFKMNTTSSFIMWNENGKFSAQELPQLAQLSPIKKTVVHDFNGDQLPDVVLAGNDYTYDVSTGYYDANKGLILMSKDGKPLSDLQTPAQTGLLLQGMVESLLWIEGEEPLLVAGFNRKAVETFKLNR